MFATERGQSVCTQLQREQDGHPEKLTALWAATGWRHMMIYETKVMCDKSRLTMET